MARTRIVCTLSCLLSILAGTAATPAAGQDLVVTVENLTADGGLFMTPVWFGFHDGTFDLYDLGSPASMGLERLAEDGTIDPLSGEFMAAAPGGNEGIVFAPMGFEGAPVLDPGETASASLAVNSANRYFSFASMVIPSNDAFVANGDPTAHEVYDANGNFTGPLTITIMGDGVRDAGTEDNTEMEAAFINQTGPDMGDTTAGGTVAVHSGFIGSAGNPGGTPIILGGTNAAGKTVDAAAADFTAAGFALARVTVTQVPEPSSLLLIGSALAGMGWMRRRR